jgi:hypothetical protein
MGTRSLPFRTLTLFSSATLKHPENEASIKESLTYPAQRNGSEEM